MVYTIKYNPKLQQRPIRYSLWKTLRQNFYWKCLLSTLLIHGCILYGIWCHLNYYENTFVKISSKIFNYSNGICAQGYNFISITFGFLLYLVYLTDCWNSRKKIASIPKRTSSEIYDLVKRMRSAIPIVWWKSVCYHYLRRTRQVTRYRNGDTITGTQVYYERVNSHSSGNVFLYESCGYKDISKELVDLNYYPLIRIRFTKGFVFACMQAANEFEEQRTRFFNENEVRDDYMEIREGLDLAEVPFIEEILVYRSAKQVLSINNDDNINSNENDEEININSKFKLIEPWYMSTTAYIFASIFLLSWPLRILIECRTSHLPYQITKLFGTNYLSPSSVNYTGTLTRTSTMESHELELANRENYIMIPSYSEAILLDPLMTTNPPNNFKEKFLNNQYCLTSLNLKNDFCARNKPIVTTNETLYFKNYGAIDDNSPRAKLNLNLKPTYNTNNKRYNLNVNTKIDASYHQKLQQILNNLDEKRQKYKACDFSPFKWVTQNKNKKFLRSKSISFINKSNLPSAQTIPRPSEILPLQNKSKLRKKILPQISEFNYKKTYSTSQNSEHLLKRSLTISENVLNAYKILPVASMNNCDDRQQLIKMKNNRNGKLLWFQNDIKNSKIAYNEPPPPYDIALKMYTPLYKVLRQSVNSISSLLHSISNNSLSNSKDMRLNNIEASSSTAKK